MSISTRDKPEFLRKLHDTVSSRSRYSLPRIRRSNCLLKPLTNREKQFFEFVYSKQFSSLDKFLKKEPNFNINVKNELGLTGLEEAIKRGSVGMVEYLLRLPDISVKNCLLHAAKEGNIEIFILLLNKIESFYPYLEFSTAESSNEFTPDLTPIVLSAQNGHYDITRLLLQRKHTIPRPHKPHCFCENCFERMKLGNLSLCVARINAYQAIANPVYICLTSPDPILEAFELSKELKACAKVEAEFIDVYTEILDQLNRFPLDLVSQCYSRQEVEIILTRKEGIEPNSSFRYPRLIKAIDYHQKDFVTHPYVQHVLTAVWFDKTQSYRTLGIFGYICTLALRMLCLPVIALLFVFAPNARLSRSLLTPMNKFLTSLASYLFFLTIIMMENFVEKRRFFTHSKTDHILSHVFIAILSLWTIGFIWEEMKQVHLLGFRRYMSKIWNWFDVIMLTLFMVTVICWILQYFLNQEVDRNRRKPYDPLVISDSAFSVACVFAFGRLLFLCQLNSYLGPLQVSLGRMVADVCRFLCFLILILFAFALGLNRLYEYYKGNDNDPTKHSSNKKMHVTSFSTLPSTVKTLFWALFAMSPVDSTDIQHPKVKDGRVPISESHFLTQFTGHILFGSFHIIAIIICWNVLIALMTTSFDKVQSNADKEWKYARTSFWLDYLDDNNRLPNPFNLLMPTCFPFRKIFKLIRRCFCPTTTTYYQFDKQPVVDSEYPLLMIELCKRYFQSQQQVKARRLTETTQYYELKAEIKSLKQLLNKDKRVTAGYSSPKRKIRRNKVKKMKNKCTETDFQELEWFQLDMPYCESSSSSYQVQSSISEDEEKLVQCSVEEENVAPLIPRIVSEQDAASGMTKSKPPPDYVTIHKFNPIILKPEPPPQRMKIKTPPPPNI